MSRQVCAHTDASARDRNRARFRVGMMTEISGLDGSLLYMWCPARVEASAFALYRSRALRRSLTPSASPPSMDGVPAGAASWGRFACTEL